MEINKRRNYKPHIDQINQTFTSSGYGYTGNFVQTLDAGDTLRVEAYSTLGLGSIQQSSIQKVICIVSGQTASNNTITQTLRGELGQWEFLKGIMTMFNLISSPDKSNPNNIIIEPYKDIFLPSITGTSNFFDDNSTQLDWTDK
jgi:hypothetical protein